ncbi:DUF294 nucleotidyltransferase-like domain-containing protein [Aureibacillus halotolerans]|uniref:CBS domain-containing protein n=1 Tax=Aureibacillus halotolerans TaxID=1508390 RepID=A0A4R6TUQ1_9BACI|nr:DUF294 nucleotidyltransferase-like domain-containing protein [Aureibacillus halotolerans]TDQ37480.1 CBS domain-containing protein [Aureibacillus halotolerans]
MTDTPDVYEEIRIWRDEQLSEAAYHPAKLRELHDHVLTRTAEAALGRFSRVYGEPPVAFNWFVMGSAGRMEQASASDQDHGIVFTEEGHEEYFLGLGKELSDGLYELGYPYCEGKVMSSYPRWCKSEAGWFEQLEYWMNESAWETIRHLIIFMDGRTVLGDDTLLARSKGHVFKRVLQKQDVLCRMEENTRKRKKAMGVFDQLLPEDHGPHTGALQLKETALLPFINSVRLMAIEEALLETSTLDRLEQLSRRFPGNTDLPRWRTDYENLLALRLRLKEANSAYEDVHYVDVKSLGKEDKKQLKHLLKEAGRIHQQIHQKVRKGCSSHAISTNF